MFKSAITEIETIDFRINEKRNYDESLLEEIEKYEKFKIKKIHFLLLRNERDDFLSSYLNYKCRSLEENLWENYVGKKRLKNIVSYHWSEKDKNISSFNTFIKVKYEKTNFFTIIIYIIILFVISILGSYTKDYIDSFCVSDNIKTEKIKSTNNKIETSQIKENLNKKINSLKKDKK